MKKHILLVENDKQELDYFLDALREIPEDDGFKCTFAATASQAVEMLNLLVPHYIFIGKRLPGREILFVIQKIKEEMRLSDTKIFFYAEPYEDGADHADSLGLSGSVQRCRSSDKLGRRLATCLAD